MSDREGRVVLDGQTVCEDGFDHNAATVFCKMLGFESGVAGGINHDDNLQFMGSSFNCTGGETNIMSCNISTGVNCNSNIDAGVMCEGGHAR